MCKLPCYSIIYRAGWNTHKASDIGTDDFQLSRSPDNTSVTHGLKGLRTHTKSGFYHDGRFATLMDAVNHYNNVKKRSLNEEDKKIWQNI